MIRDDAAEQILRSARKVLRLCLRINSAGWLRMTGRGVCLTDRVYRMEGDKWVMKKVKLGIEEMPQALEALNNALQRALLVMHQKNVDEATASISIKINMDWRNGCPKVEYKTSIRVPIEMTDKGSAVQAQQIYWDEDLRSFVMEVEGEQMRIE